MPLPSFIFLPSYSPPQVQSACSCSCSCSSTCASSPQTLCLCLLFCLLIASSHQVIEPYLLHCSNPIPYTLYSILHTFGCCCYWVLMSSWHHFSIHCSFGTALWNFEFQLWSWRVTTSFTLRSEIDCDTEQAEHHDWHTSIHSISPHCCHFVWLWNTFCTAISVTLIWLQVEQNSILDFRTQIISNIITLPTYSSFYSCWVPHYLTTWSKLSLRSHIWLCQQQDPNLWTTTTFNSVLRLILLE